MKHKTGITADAADTAALAVSGSQPAWMTLNEARERAFTGEIVFETDPEVHAYLDHGIVYYAERVTDASLGRRLLDAGVLDIEQLDRGVVRVGDIEHLGRLFDRDPSIDRDAVVVVAETATEGLVSDLANRAITSVRVTAYRHHPSGVHRWFVAPLDPAAPQRPLSAVAQLDSTVVDTLPGLPFGEGDELTIDWDDEIDDIEAMGLDDEFDVSLLDVVDAPIVESDDENAELLELSLDLAEFTDDADDAAGADTIEETLALDVLVDVETVEAADVAMTDHMTNGVASSDGFEFSVVWPDGSEEPATEATAYVEPSPEAVEEVVEEAVEEAAEVPAESVGAVDDEAVDDEAVVTLSQDGTFEFTMPPLQLSDEPELADAEVPDDVADAVRRAIAAIESASVPAQAAVAADVTTQLPEITPVETGELVEDPAPMAEAPASASGGFAPPTMAMRAEVLYGLTDEDTANAEAMSPLGESAPSAGVASVVFVDDDPADDGSGGGNDRSSALRRLIGGLRRKDH